MKTDELLIAQIEDKIDQASDRYMITSGDFLDTHQSKIVSDYCKSHKLPVRFIMYGGYADAERCRPIFLPEYIELPDSYESGNLTELPEDITELLRVIRVRAPKGSRKLTHRDYLGSLLALGIDREVTGDILVRSENSELGMGADIIVCEEMADFIELHYNKAGHVNLSAEILPISSLHTGEIHIEQKHDTVASLRLDSIVSSAFGLSRAKSSEAVRRGIVSVNSMEATKTDMEIREGDKIVLRGKGKVILAEVGSATRKDRTRITFNVYK